MKSRILLCLGLCLSLLSCNEDEQVNPSALNVTMASSSQTLVEGGEALELTVELDRTYKDMKYLYLDFGAAAGEYSNFFEIELMRDWIFVKVDGEDQLVLRIPFVAGEQKKIIRLQAEKDNLYRGNRPLELKVYSFENERVQFKSALALNFEEKTPKPVFGIFTTREADTTRTIRKGSSENFILNVTASGLFQFPQKVYLTYSGTAVEGTHFEKVAYIEFQPVNYGRPDGKHLTTNSFLALRILPGGNFDPEKTIHVKLSAAEDGEIARGEAYSGFEGETFTLEDTFTLTVTN